MDKRMTFVVAVFLLVAGSSRAQVTAIRNVRMFDGVKVVEGATVTFNDGVITAAGPSVKVPAGATVIDGRGKTLLPGLIDSHVHAFGDALQRAVRFGVTTELDMFTSAELLRKFKSEQKGGKVTDRADIYSAGTLVTVAGGHGTEYMPIPTFVPGSDPQAFIDARIAEGSDYIKLVYDDGKSFGMKFNTLTSDDLTALIAASHKRGMKAVVHATDLQPAREAIEAGADGLIHIFGATRVDAGFVKLVGKKKAFVTPTLTVIESITGIPSGSSLTTDSRLQTYLNPAEVTALKTSFRKRTGAEVELKNAFEAVRQLRAAGVPILAGTDAPNPGTAHGVSMHRELELLVEAGLTPVQALVAATSVPASTFGLKDRGRIAKGLIADLVLVAGDPTSDIKASRDIETVWRNGVALERKPEPKNAPLTEKVTAQSLADGLIADFEDGTTGSKIGMGFQPSTDSMLGGKSEVKAEVVDGGAAGTGKSLRVRADTKAGAMYPWSGSMLFFGSKPMAAVDLSSKSGITFAAKGNTDIRLMAFATSLGAAPRMTTVRAGTSWTEITVLWSAFGIDAKDIQAILFAGPVDSSVEFHIDQLRLK